MKLAVIEKIADACANEKRLEILRFLRHRKYANVSTISRSINLAIKSTSKHLQLLHNAHIIKREREGTEMYYSLNRPLNEVAKHIISYL
jgi:DNA-binding transcriptional ArsR family regulator